MVFFKNVLNSIGVMDLHGLCVEGPAGLAKAVDTSPWLITKMIEAGYIAINWQGRPFLLMNSNQVEHVAGVIEAKAWGEWLEMDADAA